jgi:hypothetical protein
MAEVLLREDAKTQHANNEKSTTRRRFSKDASWGIYIFP